MLKWKDFVKVQSRIDVPEGDLDAAWFAQNGLFMVLACSCCGMTMAAPSCFVDDDLKIYCSNCKGDDS